MATAIRPRLRASRNRAIGAAVIKLVSYNMHKGVGLDRRRDPRRILDGATPSEVAAYLGKMRQALDEGG